VFHIGCHFLLLDSGRSPSDGCIIILHNNIQHDANNKELFLSLFLEDFKLHSGIISGYSVCDKSIISFSVFRLFFAGAIYRRANFSIVSFNVQCTVACFSLTRRYVCAPLSLYRVNQDLCDKLWGAIDLEGMIIFYQAIRIFRRVV
jgi:hypothetical protein